MAKKRVRKSFSLVEKQSIIAEAKNFRGKKNELAKFLGLPVSTLASILKNKDVIEEGASKFGSYANKRKALKHSPYARIESDLFEWYSKSRKANVPVNGPLLRSKALEIAESHGIQNFTASNGWIDRFKKRHNLNYRFGGRSKESAASVSKNLDDDVINEWVNNVTHMVKDYPPKNIFNLDETVLFYGLMPNKTHALRNESHSEDLMSNRVAIMLCCNSDGSEKLQPLVIGPHCLQSVKSLPTLYTPNKSSRVTAEVFESYVRTLDDRMRNENRKIILFLDECPGHTNIDLESVKLQFFPPSCSTSVQPMELGIIRSFKYNYRSQLIRKALIECEAGEIHDVMDYRIGLTEALFLIAFSWDIVTAKCIQNCFYEAEITESASDEYFEYNDYFPTSEGLACDIFFTLDISPEEIQEYIECDKNFVSASVAEDSTDLPVQESENDDSRVEETQSVMDGSKTETTESENYSMKIEVIKSENDDREIQKKEPDNDVIKTKNTDLPIPSFYDALKGLRAIQSYVSSHEKQEQLLCSIGKLETSLYALHKTELNQRTDCYSSQ